MLFDAIAVALALVFIALGTFRGTLAGFLRMATAGQRLPRRLPGGLEAGHLAAGCSRAARRSSPRSLLGSAAFGAVYLMGAIVSHVLIRMRA